VGWAADRWSAAGGPWQGPQSHEGGQQRWGPTASHVEAQDDPAGVPDEPGGGLPQPVAQPWLAASAARPVSPRSATIAWRPGSAGCLGSSRSLRAYGRMDVVRLGRLDRHREREAEELDSVARWPNARRRTPSSTLWSTSNPPRRDTTGRSAATSGTRRRRPRVGTGSRRRRAARSERDEEGGFSCSSLAARRRGTLP
jgi:hypothetical protein